MTSSWPSRSFGSFKYHGPVGPDPTPSPKTGSESWSSSSLAAQLRNCSPLWALMFFSDEFKKKKVLFSWSSTCEFDENTHKKTFPPVLHECEILLRRGWGRGKVFRHSTACLEQGNVRVCASHTWLSDGELGRTPQVHSYTEVMWKLIPLPRKGLQACVLKCEAEHLFLKKWFSESSTLFLSFSNKICDQWGWKWTEARACIERLDWCP